MPTPSRLVVNIAWNLASVGFLAVAGLFLNYAIGRVHGPEALGLFNVVFAIFIFASQLGVLGIHFSTLRYVSEHTGRNQKTVDDIVGGAIVLVTAISAALTLLALAATPLMERIWPIQGFRAAWLSLLPGLFCFGINKVILSAINGSQHMRAFAVFQASRFALMLVALALFITLNVPSVYLSGVISFAECILLPLLACYGTKIIFSVGWKSSRTWLPRHLAFGLKVFPSGALGELNTRVDVLVVGAMLGGVQAGVYSIALLLCEGLAQLIVVVRNNINPLITRAFFANDDRAQFLTIVKRTSGYFFLGMLLAGCLLVGFFAVLVPFLLPGRGFEEAVLPLSILVTGLVSASPFLIFGLAFSQMNLPWIQTGFSAIVLATNLILNLILVPMFGINGAALATSLSFIFAGILLIALLRRVCGIRIWF